jgi:hypothetical protein
MVAAEYVDSIIQGNEIIGLTYWFTNYTLLSSYFTGSIDNLRIYDRPLSNTEIQSLYYE